MNIRAKFEPRDLWVGIYWKDELVYGRCAVTNMRYGRWIERTYYLCLLPCLPVIFTRKFAYKELW